MPIVPTSAEASIAFQVKNLIANSATFIAAVGEADYVGAKDHIFILERLPENTGLYERPFALVLMPAVEYNVSKPGYPSGMIDVVMEIDIPSGLTKDEEYYLAANFFGGTKSDMSQLGSPLKAVVNDAALRFQKVSQPQPYQRSRDTSEQDYWSVRLQLQIL